MSTIRLCGKSYREDDGSSLACMDPEGHDGPHGELLRRFEADATPYRVAATDDELDICASCGAPMDAPGCEQYEDLHGNPQAGHPVRSDPGWPFTAEDAARTIAAVSWPGEDRLRRNQWAPRMLTDPDMLAVESTRARARLDAAIAVVRVAATDDETPRATREAFATCSYPDDCRCEFDAIRCAEQAADVGARDE